MLKKKIMAVYLVGLFCMCLLCSCIENEEEDSDAPEAVINAPAFTGEFTDVCNENGNEAAHPYVDEEGVHPVILLTEAGGDHEWTNKLSPQYQPASATDTELVVCIGAQTPVDIGTCDYTRGCTIDVYIYEIEVSLIEAKTGELIDVIVFQGNSRACPESMSSCDDIYGEKVTFQAFMNWLVGYVNP